MLARAYLCLLLLGSCAPAARVQGRASSAPSVGESATMKPDLVVSLDQSHRLVELKIGQTVQVKRPAEAAEWQLDFIDTILRPLNSREMMRKPGSEGWLFRAIAPGECELTLTSVVRPEAGAPMVARFVLTVRVLR